LLTTLFVEFVNALVKLYRISFTAKYVQPYAVYCETDLWNKWLLDPKRKSDRWWRISWKHNVFAEQFTERRRRCVWRDLSWRFSIPAIRLRRQPLIYRLI